MNKFGIFDFLNKTLSNGGVDSILNTPLNSLFNTANTQQNASEKSQNEHKKISNNKPNYSQKAVILMLKNHDKLSKEIDLQNGKK